MGEFELLQGEADFLQGVCVATAHASWYAGSPLTEGMVAALNGQRVFSALLEDAEETGYPVSE